MAEAFQLTVAAHPDRVALRLKDDELTMTWGEYGDRVRRSRPGLAGLGLEPGDTLGLMLTNRPEFHWFDSAALHAGATPFSIYNTYAPRADPVPGARRRHRIVVTEAAFLDQVAGLDGVEHLVVVDGGGPEGSLSIADVEAAATADFDFESAWRAVGPDDLLTLIYTSGTTGPPKGVQLTHENLLSAVRGFDDVIAVPRRGAGGLLAPDGAHRRALRAPTTCRWSSASRTTCCPDPRQVVAYLPEVQADVVLRGAADLGEAQGRHRGRDRGRAGRGAQAGDRVGARGRAAAR